MEPGRGPARQAIVAAGTDSGRARPAMKDVASRASVALKTVSRVVNGEPGMTPETAERVGQDPGEPGRIAACLLFGRLAGDSGPARRIELATRLIARGSGEIPPETRPRPRPAR